MQSMSGLRETLLSQRNATEARIRDLAAQVEEHRQLWMGSSKALETAKEELRKIDGFLAVLEKAAAQEARPSIKQAVLDVMKHRPNGMTALEILAEINERYFEGRLARTSLSPQLSRLKDVDKKITLRGNKWLLIRSEEPSLFSQKS